MISRVASLGPCTYASPLHLPRYVADDAAVLRRIELSAIATPAVGPPSAGPPATDDALEKAGPREHVFFDPKMTRAALVTSGGLCPGINNVIRGIVLELVYRYGVTSVTGFKFGFAGVATRDSIPLDVDRVRHVHTQGGTMLGTSRTRHEPKLMVDALEAQEIDLFFAIGGDGTMAATHAIAEEVMRRGLRISVVGVPKTIDNDIAFVDKTFGFETAVSVARVVIDAAHTEALSVRGGIGLVKLMGRDAGFIAAHAALASHDVNVCLVPEVPFELERLLEHLEQRIEARGHAVIVAAEGCGKQRDVDIGTYLRDAIARHFEARGLAHVIKYIDPSYMVRGVSANAIDAMFCVELARNAVHAAMAGKTDMMIGRLHRVFTQVPLELVLSEKKRVDPDGDLWLAVTESTGQPSLVARRTP